MINPFLVASIEATRYAREALDAYRESEWADPDQVDEAVWTIGRYLTEAKGLLDDLYARQASSSQPDRGR